jgi:imidazolonepropionase-like amidohydrolase
VWRHPILSKYVPRGILEPRAVRRPIAPDEDYNVITVAKTATELQRVGVNVNIGAHGQREGLGSHWDIWMLAKGGMTSLEAIRAATLNGAKYLGMERDIGSLEIGKLADLIIIDADVIKDIEKTDKITHVIQNGRVYDVATMNEIGATPNKRKTFYFERGTAGSDAFERLSTMGIMHGNDHSQCNH